MSIEIFIYSKLRVVFLDVLGCDSALIYYFVIFCVAGFCYYFALLSFWIYKGALLPLLKFLSGNLAVFQLLSLLF